MSRLMKNFYLLSFLPAIAYWYLETYYPLKIAVIGGLILAIIEILLERLFTKHVHSLSIFNLFIILCLGGISLLGEDGVWFKLQPFFTGIAIASFLTFKLIRGPGLMFEMMSSFQNVKLPVSILRLIETHFAIFTTVYAFFMAFVAFKLSTDIWLFFKTAGFYLSFVGFMLLEIIYLRVKFKPRNKIVIENGKRF